MPLLVLLAMTVQEPVTNSHGGVPLLPELSIGRPVVTREKLKFAVRRGPLVGAAPELLPIHCVARQ